MGNDLSSTKKVKLEFSAFKSDHLLGGSQQASECTDGRRVFGRPLVGFESGLLFLITPYSERRQLSRQCIGRIEPPQ